MDNHETKYEIERDLKSIFGSISIDFKGRNYAMDGILSLVRIFPCVGRKFSVKT